jgi:hypothetical protein
VTSEPFGRDDYEVVIAQVAAGESERAREMASALT